MDTGRARRLLENRRLLEYKCFDGRASLRRASLPRLLLTIAAAVIGCFAGHALAQEPNGYPAPDRTTHIIVPHGLGTGPDVLARLLAGKVAERWKTSVVVENRLGAAGDIGMAYVAAAPPDGYTFLLVAAQLSIAPALKKNLSFDPVKSFEPIALLGTSKLSLLVAPNVPAKTFPEFLALARQSPGKLNYATIGTGSIQHVTTELLKLETKVDLFPVYYKDAPSAFRDLLTGEVQAMVQPLQTAAPQVRANSIRMLAVMSGQREPAFPDVPTMAELGYPGMIVEVWYGLFAPAQTPRQIVTKWNSEVNALLQEPDTRDALVRQGTVIAGGAPERLGEVMTQELARWKRVVSEAGIKPE
jgi:tripartite-type tricarboxylate transporter receptor subunit TctC